MKSNKKNGEVSFVETIADETLDELMGQKFAIYAKDVIQDRAIPDARDGLKPVQRRILYDMWVTGNTIEKPTKKCAHIVGDVMGKYHPHGDSSIYEALVHMSQKWAYRYPLIDFQGNNGSIDGDGPAAYRYTEARLSALASELLHDIDEETVDMELTFDDTLYEPSVLPAHFPNLFANGSEGIAVGISTNIPPHNLGELSEAIIYRLKNPEATIDEYFSILPGPDFPTGGIIYQSESLKDIYRTGRGKVTISSKVEIVENKGHRQIIVSEIPYQVNKSLLVKSIDKIRHDRTIPGIEEVRDESDKDGLRIAIDLKDECKPEAVLAYLLAKTPLRSSYSAHMVAIVDNRPKTINLLDYLDAYITHQLEVITRRTKFLLEKNNRRLEIVKGLFQAISCLDEVVRIIRLSNDKSDAKINLQARFSFSDSQVEAILMMPLYRLSNTDIKTLEKEENDLEKAIKKYQSLLASQSKREEVIIKELSLIKEKYGDQRRTAIEEEEVSVNIDKRDLIADEEVMCVVTRDGYLKRSSIKSWKSSGGERGAKPGIKSGDIFLFLGRCSTKDYLLLFTERGYYLEIPVNEVRETKWNDEGFHVSSLASIGNGEKLVSAFVVRNFRNDVMVVALAKSGLIKRMSLASLELQRRSKSVMAFKLDATDALVKAMPTSGNDNLLLVSETGEALVYNENEINPTSPRSGGIKAGGFKGRPVVGFLSFNPDEKKTKVALITDRGHLRVFDEEKLELSKRTARATPLYGMYKNDPHVLIFIDKVSDKAAPYSYDAVLNGGLRIDITFQDWNLTQEKTAHKAAPGELMGFPARGRILHVSPEVSLVVDDNFKTFKPTKSIENANEQNLDPFEQISLFDAEDE